MAVCIIPFTPHPFLYALYPTKPTINNTIISNIIRNILNTQECYAICEKENGIAIGAVELILNAQTDITERDDECELGYWLGKPFWNKGYMSEAVREMLRHGFNDLAMNTIWCRYYEGNERSKRVQEKAGFIYIIRISMRLIKYTQFVKKIKNVTS